jgi:penicillin amidase
MDLIRRQGEGRLSEILGLQALSSDEFQVMLGLDRAAQRNWQALPANVHQVLAIYTQGVNALIQEEEQNNSLPFLFKLLNYRPQPWTPIDSLVIQGELTQTGAFSTMPLDYALMVKALGYQRTFSGASIPGFPVTPIGRNQHISWSLTDVQNQSTFFYVEHTDPAHPQQYYWNGAWRQMQHLTYTIPVKGQPPVRQEVYLTVHGPSFPAGQGIAGETLSVDWMGALPSTDGEALLAVLKATSFSQFRSALSLWTAPTQNLVYADDQGNIGMISPVANNYPYYIGTSWNFFDDGYRADKIYAELTSKQQLTVQDMEHMQNSTHDYLAGLMVPQLLKTLQTSSLSSSEQQAEALLQSWNENMDVTSPAASIWWTFWTHYMADTFEPWWQAYNVPVTAHPDLAVQPGQTSLDEDLET